MENLRKLKIKSMSNEIFSLTIPHDTTIAQLKAEIFKVSQVPASNQRLVFMGKLLENSERLDKYIKEDD